MGSAYSYVSAAFVRTLVSHYEAITGHALEDATVLDYGCGWGCLIRLLYNYVPHEQIYAVDPLDAAIELCRKHGVKAHLALSEYVPRSLPFACRFDLIYAFSVFTHLSEKTAHIVLSTLRDHIAQAWRDGWDSLSNTVFLLELEREFAVPSTCPVSLISRTRARYHLRSPD
jgi:trans-aconitate methyltransferase